MTMLDAFPDLDNLSPNLPPFNQDGVLPPGDYAPHRASFESTFVPTGRLPVRQAIYTGWNRHRQALLRSNVAPSARQLLNGSFTTSKVMPGDLDLVVEVPVSGNLNGDDFDVQVHALAPVLDLLQGPATKDLYNCDAYFLLSLPPAHTFYERVTVKAIRYWTKWFGQTRAGNPKGRIWTRVGGLP